MLELVDGLFVLFLIFYLGPIGAALLLSFLDKECGISGIKSMFCGVYVYHGAWEPLLIGGIILPVAATVLTWFLVPFCRPINTKFTFSLLIGGFIFRLVWKITSLIYIRQYGDNSNGRNRLALVSLPQT